MKRSATRLLASLLAFVAMATIAAPASAALRVPQVPVLGGTLQGYLNSVGEAINVLTDQDATQAWSKTSSNTTTYTLMFQNSPTVPVQQFGLYNTSAPGIPPLFFLMSGTAGVLGFSTATFQPGNMLVVNRFDSNGNFLSTTTFAGVDPSSFGFYLAVPNGTFYTQDSRNPGGLPQALTYRGTGTNAGTWWLCWEDNSIGGADQDFDDLVVLMESVNPTPVSKSTWGQLKSRFR